ADPGGQQYRRRLAIGQIPVPYNERQNECDQQEIEEIEHVADCRRGEDLPLIDGEFLLLLQIFEHNLYLPIPFIHAAIGPPAGFGRHSRMPPPTSAIVWFLGGDGNE